MQLPAADVFHQSGLNSGITAILSNSPAKGMQSQIGIADNSPSLSFLHSSPSKKLYNSLYVKCIIEVLVLPDLST